MQNTATVHADGTGRLDLDGQETTTVATGTIEQARRELLSAVMFHARRTGQPVDVLARDPETEHLLRVHPDGRVHPLPGTATDAHDHESASPESPAAPTAADWTPPPAPAGAAAAPEPRTRREAREQSFLSPSRLSAPPPTGWHAILARLGFKTGPSSEEVARWEDERAISQHWPGPRTIAVLNGKGGAGKALHAHEPVLTTTGYRPIGSLAVGDLVMGRDGFPHVVLGVYPQGQRDLYRVTLTDGTSILADAEHLWEVETPADRMIYRGECTGPACTRPVLAKTLCVGHYEQAMRGLTLRPLRTGNYRTAARTCGGARLMTTAQMLAHGLSTARDAKRGVRHHFFIPVAEPVQFAGQPTPVEPYLLGLLLGDGSLSDATVAFSTADAQLVGALTTALPPGVTARRKDRYDYRLVRTAPSGPNPLRRALTQLGLNATSEHKFIPEVYKQNDVATRTAVLQGLLDTDGWVERGTAAGYCTVSAALADDVQHLAESLGCVVTRSKPCEPTYQHRGQSLVGQAAHRLRITPPRGLHLFRLERKQSRMRRGQRIPYRAVSSITPAGRGEAVCIAVSAPDNLFLTRGCVPTHNTPATALLSAMFARAGGSGVLAWDSNVTRGTLGWRTEQGTHDATVLDLLPRTDELLTPGARAADLAAVVHHQTVDKYDVLRSNPLLVSTEQKLTPDQLDAVHAVAAKYYRLIIMDSGNDEGDALWLRMIDHADQIVVATTTRPDHAEAGRLLLDALADRDEHSARLAEQAVVLVSQADREEADAPSIAQGFDALARAVVTVPYDPAMRQQWLRVDNLAPATQRAYLRAAAAVASGL